MSLLSTLASLLKPAPRATPADYADKIRAGQAVLVDVREANEWRSGVAESAALLPLSDLTGARKRWAAFLAEANGCELLVYCASGTRSGIAARLLNGQGHRAVNVGGIFQWVNGSWPIVPPSDKMSRPRKKGTS